MSREIKFRAWTGKQMMYQDKQYLESFIRRVVMQVLMDHDFPEVREHESYLPKGTVIDDYLLQFTGLLDGEEQEIYEGDIVKYCLHSGSKNARVGTVTYNSGAFMLDATTYLSTGMYKEVIGNIYETPLEEKQ